MRELNRRNLTQVGRITVLNPSDSQLKDLDCEL